MNIGKRRPMDDMGQSEKSCCKSPRTGVRPPQNLCKSSGCSSVHLHHRGYRDRKIPGACRADRLAKVSTLQVPPEILSQKLRYRITKEEPDTNFWSTHIHTCTQTHTHMYTYMNTYSCTQIHILMYIYRHVHIHIPTHTHTHMNICRHVHIQTCT